MKITKAKYNWLVAQYNYRKNKEEIIEISDEEYERLTGNKNPNNNSYYVNFMFYTSNHQTSILHMVVLNPGQFCKFNVTKQNDIYHIQCTRNYDNQYEDIVITTDIETQALHITEFPIIAGKGTFDNNIIAYIGIDPNNDLPLSFTNNGQHVTSGEYTYDLNNGVCISNENKQGLYKLKCDYNETYLRIWN